MPFTHRFFRCAGVRCAVVLLLAVRVGAHDGPEHVIEELTLQLARGETADLLLQRAIEYRVLGKNSEAAHDLEWAVQLEPGLFLAQRELGRAYHALGKTNEAVEVVSQALKIPTEQSDEIASLRIVRAEFLAARSEFKKALEDCETAIRTRPGNVEWYLLRSDLQRRLKLPKERITGLQDGIAETGAGILETELTDALLDDGKYALALPRIEEELRTSRIRGSWLIRRARVHLGLEEKDAAKADLQEALAEIGPRLGASASDAALLTDRARAQELLGDLEEARKTYEQARDAGAEEWVRDKIKVLKAGEEAREKKREKDLERISEGEKK